MPRKRPPARKDDFRSDDQLRVDRKLKGAWWRCEAHGLTQEPVILGGVTYCPNLECERKTILVHSVLDEHKDEPRNWNQM